MAMLTSQLSQTCGITAQTSDQNVCARKSLSFAQQRLSAHFAGFYNLHYLNQVVFFGVIFLVFHF